jgi:hypothetical protein
MYKRMSGCVMALALLFSGAAGAADWGQVVDDMKFMREEEKLARDVYATLYDHFYSQGTTLYLFDHIASSEQRHMDAMLNLLAKYGIPDSAVDGGQGVYPDSCPWDGKDKEACQFNNDDLAKLYPRLIKDGEKSPLAAFVVGAYIEELDISDLFEAIATAADFPIIQSVYGNLLCGSGNHLRAFARNIELMTGLSYLDATEDYLAAIRPSKMDEDVYEPYMAALDAILTGDMERCGKGIGQGPKGPQGPNKPQGRRGWQ